MTLSYIGLASAIRLRQLAAETGEDLSVCLIEKGSKIGAHILSGNVFQPIALNELLPDWKATGVIFISSQIFRLL